MKFAIVAVIAVMVACVAARPEEYTSKYDGIDLDEILKSDRLFNNYFKCLMEKGKCTPDGSELKRVLPDALKTNCSKCTEKQRNGSNKVIKYLVDNRSAQWQTLQAKYDPENIYLTKFRPEAAKSGITV